MKPAPAHDVSVFINCPFDPPYKLMMRALIFAVFDCGFFPRSALEEDNAGEVRFHKIVRIIEECRFGIHDISRVQLDRSTRLPRFNMPLELGLFLGATTYGNDRNREKQCLILDRDRFRYQKFCSDISGQDVRAHATKPAKAIGVVRDWLSIAAAQNNVVIPSGSRIAERFRSFEAELPEWCRRQRLEPRELTFTDQHQLIEAWLKTYPWSGTAVEQ
ncbi:MAG: hypothetical protein ACRD3J_16340 [Thermoanaerobaculia bacterium]